MLAHLYSVFNRMDQSSNFVCIETTSLPVEWSPPCLPCGLQGMIRMQMVRFVSLPMSSPIPFFKQAYKYTQDASAACPKRSISYIQLMHLGFPFIPVAHVSSTDLVSIFPSSLLLHTPLIVSHLCFACLLVIQPFEDGD